MPARVSRVRPRRGITATKWEHTRRPASRSWASGGPRDNAVAGAEQACALAVGLRDAARRAAHGLPRVHLFLATPMGLALLLGHRWNRIAPTMVYEDLAALGYEAAFTVSA